MSIGRGRSICEYDEIMQILPGSSNDPLLINASYAFGNMRTPVVGQFEKDPGMVKTGSLD